MKSLIIFCYTFIWLGFIWGGEWRLEIAGYPSKNLVGSVKQIREFTGSSLGNLVIKRVVTLNENGRMVSEENYCEDGHKISSNFYYYNEKGLLKEIVGTRVNQTGTWRSEFHYGKNGKIREVLSLNTNGEIDWRNEYHYCNQGLLTEKIVYLGRDMESMRELYYYNDEGKIIHWITNFPDGQPLKKVDFVYNDLGLISEERYYNENSIYKKKLYHYNKNLLWERVQIEDGQGEVKEATMYFYNGDSKLVEKITRNEKHDIQEHRYMTYDYMGNIFSQIDSNGCCLLKEITYK